MSRATSHSESQSELSSEDSARKLKRTKQGVGYNGKQDMIGRLNSHPGLKTLISSKTASTDLSEEKKKPSKKTLRGRVKKSASDTPFPSDAIYSFLKTYDKKVVQDLNEEQFWKQLSGFVANCPKNSVIEELSKFRRLDLLRAIKFLNVKEEKFIIAVLKHYLLAQSPLNSEVIRSLVSERKQLPKELRSAYDTAIYNLLSVDQSAPYFQQIFQTPNPTSNSSDVKLTALERTYIQSGDPLKLLLQYRNGAKDEAAAMRLTLSVAQSGNPEIFIHYIAEVFNHLLSSGHGFSEVREGVKEFLHEIRPIFLADGTKMYAVLKQLNETLQTLVNGGSQESVDPIDTFIHAIIYEDSLPALVDRLLKDLVNAVKCGDENFDSLAAEHMAIENCGSKQEVKEENRFIKSLDQLVILNFEPDQLFVYAEKVFENKPKAGFSTPWLVEFVKRLDAEGKLIPVVEEAIKCEVSDPRTATPKNQSPLRGNNFSSLFIAEALRYSSRDYSTKLFQLLKESFGKSEKEALEYWYHENNIRQSGRVELLAPEKLAENENRFFGSSSVIIGELLSNMEISPTTVEILSVVRKHFKLREKDTYAPKEIWEVLSNLWILRGVNGNLTTLIEELPTRYENRLQDPIYGVMIQFINHVMLKISVPNCYSDLPEDHPRHLFHTIYHKQIIKNFKSAVRKTDAK